MGKHKPRMKVTDKSKPHAPAAKAALGHLDEHENRPDIDPKLYAIGKEVKSEPVSIGKVNWNLPEDPEKKLRDVGKLGDWEIPEDPEKQLNDVGKLDESRYPKGPEPYQGKKSRTPGKLGPTIF